MTSTFAFYKRKPLVGGIILLCISFIVSNILILDFQSFGSEYIIIAAAVIVCGVAGTGLTMYALLKNKHFFAGRNQ